MKLIHLAIFILAMTQYSSAQLNVYAGAQITDFTFNTYNNDDLKHFNPLIGVGYFLQIKQRDPVKAGYVFQVHYNTSSYSDINHGNNYHFRNSQISFTSGPSIQVYHKENTRTRMAWLFLLTHTFRSDAYLSNSLLSNEKIHLHLNTESQHIKSFLPGVSLEIGQDFKIKNNWLGATLFGQLLAEDLFKDQYVYFYTRTYPFVLGLKVGYSIGSNKGL